MGCGIYPLCHRDPAGLGTLEEIFSSPCFWRHRWGPHPHISPPSHLCTEYILIETIIEKRKVLTGISLSSSSGWSQAIGRGIHPLFVWGSPWDGGRSSLNGSSPGLFWAQARFLSYPTYNEVVGGILGSFIVLWKIHILMYSHRFPRFYTEKESTKSRGSPREAWRPMWLQTFYCFYTKWLPFTLHSIYYLIQRVYNPSDKLLIYWMLWNGM